VVAGSAVAWLTTQQQADGGFEVAGFPGFETPDAVLAIGAGAQLSGWNVPAARAAVLAQVRNGKTALDALDDLVDGGTTPAQAAKLIVLVTAPLGLDASDFDPSNDSASAVNLVTLVTSAAGDGSYSSMAFNGRLYTALALRLLAQPIPAALVANIRAGQQANGGWNYTGLPAGTDFDPDTTGLAVQALVAAGLGRTDPSIAKALTAFATNQSASGAWSAFGADDPNSTSLAMLAITAVGGDVSSPCWRDLAVPAKAGTPYASPLLWLKSRQASDGHIISPNDGFGVNTFATSQAVQAISRNWLPIATAASFTCASTPAAPDASANGSYVKAVYLDVLGRSADAAGLAFHTARLAAGVTRSSVPRALTGSTEYRDRVVIAYYADYLATTPTAQELAAGGALLKAGKRTALQVSLLASPAYFGHAGSTNAGFVEALYRDVLDRQPDPAGSARWVAALDAGRSRAAVATALVNSGEARSVIVKGLYLKYLRRAGDAGGVTFWRGKLGKGASVESVINSLVGSKEYFAWTQKS